MLYLNEPGGHGPDAHAAPPDARRAGQIQSRSSGSEQDGDPEIPHADRPVRAGLSNADLGARADGCFQGARASTFELYGARDAKKPGTYRGTTVCWRGGCRERGVRFVQLFHRGWDQHAKLPTEIAVQCQDTDRGAAALIADLKQRGLLEDTLVVWGGEFGRTVYCQGKLTVDDYGRDHHPRCFTIWMAGAGVKSGATYGQTDDFSYNIVQDPVHVHDLHATMLHLLGIDHEALTFKFQGRHHRLTDVHGELVEGVLA